MEEEELEFPTPEQQFCSPRTPEDLDCALTLESFVQLPDDLPDDRVKIDIPGSCPLCIRNIGTKDILCWCPHCEFPTHLVCQVKSVHLNGFLSCAHCGGIGDEDSEDWKEYVEMVKEKKDAEALLAEKVKELSSHSPYSIPTLPSNENSN